MPKPWLVVGLWALAAARGGAAEHAPPRAEGPALAAVGVGAFDFARLGQIFDAARARPGAAAPRPASAGVRIEVGPRPSPASRASPRRRPGSRPTLVVPQPTETAAYRRTFRLLLDRPELTDQYDDLILKYAQAYRLDPRLLKAIISAESEFASRALSPMGARGLMQVMPATAEMLGVPTYRLYEPEANIRAGAAYVANLFRMAWKRYRFGKLAYRRAPSWLVQRIVASYNAGPRFLFRSGGWYEQTRRYVRKVLLFYRSGVTQFRRPDRRWRQTPTLVLAPGLAG